MDSFLFSRLFWGSIVILIGLSIILNSFFKINIPFFKIIVSILFIYLGLKMLLGSFGVKRSQESDSTVFGSNEVRVEQLEDRASYEVVFGEQIIDLRNTVLHKGENRIKVAVVFGSSKIIVQNSHNVHVKASVVFSSARFPDGNQSAFGSYEYNKSGDTDVANRIYIDADVVFGSLEVIERP